MESYGLSAAESAEIAERLKSQGLVKINYTVAAQ